MKNKMKTKKIASKRFNVTKNGVILHRKQNARHLRSNKSKKQLRKFKKSVVISKAMERTIRTLLPYA